MDRLDVSSATLGAGAVAAAGAAVLAGLADPPRRAPAVAAGLAMLALAGWNASGDRLLGPTWAKGQALELEDLAFERWNAHSYVVGMRPRLGPPAFWGKGEDAPEVLVESMLFVIDGAAGTPMTAWDGDRESLAWVQYDVTSLPYQIRRGDVAVIGVGGGRDVLSALWFRNPRVTGIELNRIFVDVLEDSHRGYAGLADRPEVRLVNAEARSFLSRSDERFDVIQMSLVDTWASTGAGAFTLSENGLYTVEGWRVFLDHLKPDGVLSVSRWFASNDVSETSRLLSLAVASLLERGVREPARHLVLAARGVVATLLVSPRPFSAADVAKLRRVAKRRGFSLIAAPGVPTDDPRLRAILASEGPEALAAATRHPHFDYSPPTDRRPYFFNLLKLGSFREAAKLREGPFGLAGVVMGNLRATRTLVALFAMASLFVLAVIVYPLLRAGRPQLDAGGFALCLAYFAGIGAGFMTIQIALLEVFTLFLGHPTYAYPVILFSMILFAGLGSLLSERIPLERTRWPWGVPLLAALVTLASAAAIPVAVEAAVREGLLPRIALVVGLTAPLSLLLGCCFPLGMRLLERLSPDAGAWAWGVNGAVGVLASIAAVAVSLGLGIDRNFWIAAALYAGVALAGAGLARAAREPV